MGALLTFKTINENRDFVSYADIKDKYIRKILKIYWDDSNEIEGVDYVFSYEDQKIDNLFYNSENFIGDLFNLYENFCFRDEELYNIIGQMVSTISTFDIVFEETDAFVENDENKSFFINFVNQIDSMFLDDKEKAIKVGILFNLIMALKNPSKLKDIKNDHLLNVVDFFLYAVDFLGEGAEVSISKTFKTGTIDALFNNETLDKLSNSDNYSLHEYLLFLVFANSTLTIDLPDSLNCVDAKWLDVNNLDAGIEHFRQNFRYCGDVHSLLSSYKNTYLSGEKAKVFKYVPNKNRQ